MRGKLGSPQNADTAARNIPAYAGKTPGAPLLTGPSSEHPRVCGENRISCLHAEVKFGTSPRMRGKHQRSPESAESPRNIPAYAGKTPFSAAIWISAAEHPRVCGENVCTRGKLPAMRGTSPRMRGKHHDGIFGFGFRRNIPAYAGKTCMRGPRAAARAEHPRVCGENRNV